MSVFNYKINGRGLRTKEIRLSDLSQQPGRTMASLWRL